jgi:hypothetical protein
MTLMEMQVRPATIVDRASTFISCPCAMPIAWNDLDKIRTLLSFSLI